MIYYYLISLISILISSQSRLFFWPVLPIIFAACWQADVTSARVLTLAFITGLLLDLFIGSPLGESAIFLLLAAGLVYLLKSRFSDNWRIFLVVLVFSQIIFYVSNR